MNLISNPFVLPEGILSGESHSARWQKPLIMGILNATPDSFSDGGHYSEVSKAKERALEMVEQGAELVDIGGEATNPGAEPVSVDEELRRVIPIIEAIRAESALFISVDTSKPEVMQAALDAGASMINDVTGFSNKVSRSIVAKQKVPICVMHMKGIPASMQNSVSYPENVVEEINHFFKERIALCIASGIQKDKIILDPGFGFGKLACHNLQIIRELDCFHALNCPILLGFSRKNTIGQVLNQPVEKRLIGGIAMTVYAALRGVRIVRTHDIEATKQALTMVDAIQSPAFFQ